MDKKVKTTEIIIKDHYGENCLKDSVNRRNDEVRSPKGFVEIYDVLEDGTKKLIGKNNLVLYMGREWLASKAFNLANPYISQSQSEFISWFGLGDGGVIPGDPFNPSPPVITQTDLSSRVMINPTDASCADYHVISPGYPEEGYYKKPFEGIEYQTDSLNDDKYLIVKISVAIASTDANGKQLSEAALFTAESNLGSHSGPFHIFARVTFPSIVKTSDRRLIFAWFLYF
jgi:hypothetical protein